MNKISKGALALTLACTITGCGGSSDSGDKETLTVFNWGEYIDPAVVDAFEDEFNCNVVYETFDSNEMMYTKFMGGNHYDVMIPSEYMIERMITEDLLQEIDKDTITNMNSIDESLLNQTFDLENKYWVPYFYGNVGILYDTTQVDKKDLDDGWEILRNEKYQGNIYMYDSERDSFMVALKALGYSMNSTDETEVENAYNWLVEQRQTMDPVYVGDESIDNMRNGEKAMAVMYSGDAAAVMAENEDMAFFMPEEGTNIWFDGFVISKDCKVSKLANEFINYMISDDNALLNTQAVGYLTANKNAAKIATDEDYKGISAYGIRMAENDEIFAYQSDEIKEMFNSRWTKVINQ
ncbi:MAG: extracellular solute-binding protein [Coprobacillaceae bacterium]